MRADIELDCRGCGLQAPRGTFTVIVDNTVFCSECDQRMIDATKLMDSLARLHPEDTQSKEFLDMRKRFGAYHDARNALTEKKMLAQVKTFSKAWYNLLDRERQAARTDPEQG